jgi:hypothetical protein
LIGGGVLAAVGVAAIVASSSGWFRNQPAANGTPASDSQAQSAPPTPVADQLAGGPATGDGTVMNRESAAMITDPLSAPAIKTTVEIVNAKYGKDANQMDVTAKLQQHAAGMPAIVLPSAGPYCDSFDGDPAQFVHKEMVVQYRINGRAAEVSFNDSAPIILPIPPTAPVKLEIVKAEYGAGSRMIDVTEFLRKYAGDSTVVRLPSTNYAAHFGDPAPFEWKKMSVNYRINGRDGLVSLDESTLIELPVTESDAEREARLGSGALGNWIRGDGWLISPAESNARFVLPGHLPQDFSVTMRVTRLTGREPLSIGIPLFGLSRHAMVTLDFQPDFVGGLESIDNKRAFESDTAHRGQLLNRNKDAVITCKVNKDSIVCMVDGVKVADWQGDFARLTAPVADAAVDKQSMFLTTETRFLIRNVKVSPSGSSQVAMQPSAGSPPNPGAARDVAHNGGRPGTNDAGEALVNAEPQNVKLDDPLYFAPPAALASFEKADFVVTPDEFANETRKETHGGFDKYGGKVIEVSGRVNGFFRTIGGKEILKIATSDGPSLRCIMAQEGLWKTTMPGTTVTVRGQCTKYVPIVSLRECRIVAADPKGAVVRTPDELIAEILQDPKAASERYGTQGFFMEAKCREDSIDGLTGTLISIANSKGFDLTGEYFGLSDQQFAAGETLLLTGNIIGESGSKNSLEIKLFVVERKTGGSTAQPRKNSSTTDQPLRPSLQEFADEWTGAKIPAAREKYAGRQVEISGVIDTIISMGQGEVRVYVHSGGLKFPVILGLDAPWTPAAVGQTVVVRGRAVQGTPKSFEGGCRVEIVDAQIISLSGESAPRYTVERFLELLEKNPDELGNEGYAQITGTIRDVTWDSSWSRMHLSPPGKPPIDIETFYWDTAAIWWRPGQTVTVYGKYQRYSDMAGCVFQHHVGVLNGRYRTPAAGQPTGAAEVSPTILDLEKPAEVLDTLPFPRGGLFVSQIDKVQADGTVRVGPPADKSALPPANERMVPSKGNYLGVVADQKAEEQQGLMVGARLVRVAVLEASKDGKAKLQVAKSAVDKIRVGEGFVLFRPTGKTSEQLKDLPEILDLEDWNTTPIDAPPWSILLRKSLGNLQEIGRALHNSYEVFGSFPPAVLIGPDGKPWHSWRVFILRHLDASETFEAYRWDEPWDGPNNRKLLDRMPKVYADPIYGANKDFYTNYVAITGDGMGFSAKGAGFDGTESSALEAGRTGTRYEQFADGTTNTLIVGHVGFDRKIPWMKPEDVEITPNLPKLGQKGGFALLPYDTDKGRVAPFMRADAWVFGIRDSINDATLRSIFTIAGNEASDWSAVPCLGMADLPKHSTAGGSTPVVYLVRVDGQIKARLVMEPVKKK